MIRLALRQFRTEAAIGIGLLAALAIVLGITGPHLAQVSDAFQSACKPAGDCATAQNPAFEIDLPLRAFLPFIGTVAPALMGLFFGAPLIARELETGTFHLAWTQSVTRRRWLAVKLALVGSVAMLIGGLLTWMIDWWMSPIDAANQDRFDIANFGIHGVAPVGYAAFAVALGTMVGLLLRRTVPAMAATLAGFVAARLVVGYWIRPHLAAPLHKSLPLALSVSASTGNSSIGAGSTIPNGWVLSTSAVDKAGHAITTQSLIDRCHPTVPPSPAFHSCLSNFHTLVTYQAGSRFWPFQWAELGIFLAAAIALCGFTYWWLRRQYA